MKIADQSVTPKWLDIDRLAAQAGNCGAHPMPAFLSWQAADAWGATPSRFQFARKRERARRPRPAGRSQVEENNLDRSSVQEP